MSAYDASFFAGHQAGSEGSAHVVIPILRELIRFSSVVDVGCGTGSWLRAISELGTSDFHGFDGRWAIDAGLLIPADRFTAADLANPPAPPRRFDLALSLEVAEHLPESAADRFVQFLTQLAPVVVFSAAIPNQGGTDHVNEQWPDYWAEKFGKRGYVCVDALRPRVWANTAVRWWYAQNTLVYVERGELERQPGLKGQMQGSPLRLVHPECFMLAANHKLGLGELVRETPGAVRRTLMNRFRPWA